MRRLALSTPAALLSAAALSLVVLSGAASADSRYDQIFPGAGLDARAEARLDAYGEPYSRLSTSTPRDFVSSHVCINGYRWITRETDRFDDNPARNAIPVRCH